MKIKMTFLLLVAGLLILPGCKSKREKLTEDMLDNMEETVAVMETVKDKESAKAAESKLDKLSKEREELTKEAEAMGEPDEKEEEELKKKYEDRMKKVFTKFMKESMRIATNPELAGVLKPEGGAGLFGKRAKTEEKVAVPE